MGDVFHGWRRKAGVAFALPSFLITLLWCVSLQYEFEISVGIPNSFQLRYVGHNGLLGFRIWQGGFVDEYPNGCRFFPPVNDWSLDEPMFADVFWLLRSPALGCFNDSDATLTAVGVFVSMSLIAIPLTLLSAYLILWPDKRRDGKLKAPADSGTTVSNQIT